MGIDQWRTFADVASAQPHSPNGIKKSSDIKLNLICRTRPVSYFLPHLMCDWKKPEPVMKMSFNVVQPDLLVVCDPAKLDTHGCLGAPDWIIEIISPSTASKDHIVKRELYERFGVNEYWIVQPMDRLVMVYQLTPDGRYGRPAVYSESDVITVGILPELQIDLKPVFKGAEEI